MRQSKSLRTLGAPRRVCRLTSSIHLADFVGNASLCAGRPVITDALRPNRLHHLSVVFWAARTNAAACLCVQATFPVRIRPCIISSQIEVRECSLPRRNWQIYSVGELEALTCPRTRHYFASEGLNRFLPNSRTCSMLLQEAAPGKTGSLGNVCWPHLSFAMAG
jgi:hypothetical protein